MTLDTKHDIPEKLGELVANMYISSVQKIMSSLHRREQFLETEVGARGLFLHKKFVEYYTPLRYPQFQKMCLQKQESLRRKFTAVPLILLPCVIFLKQELHSYDFILETTTV